MWVGVGAATCLRAGRAAAGSGSGGPGLGVRASGLSWPSCALSCTVRLHMAHGARAVLGIEVCGSGWVLPHARVLAGLWLGPGLGVGPRGSRSPAAPCRE